MAIYQSYGVNSVQHEISRRQILLSGRRKLVSRMRFLCDFYILLLIRRDKTVINCINECDFLTSFILSYFLTDLEPLLRLQSWTLKSKMRK